VFLSAQTIVAVCRILGDIQERQMDTTTLLVIVLVVLLLGGGGFFYRRRV